VRGILSSSLVFAKRITSQTIHEFLRCDAGLSQDAAQCANGKLIVLTGQYIRFRHLRLAF
jgi:hypothetical protein